MNNPTVDLLERYLKKETSATENKWVEDWLATYQHPNPEWLQMDEAAQQQWLAARFKAVQKTLDLETPKLPSPKQKTLWLGFRVAAVAALLVLSFTLYLNWATLNSWLHPAQAPLIVLSSQHKQHLTLADGSSIWLNAGAKLSYPQQFKGKTREVYLSGEAYFDIAHDAVHPFIIHTGEVSTTVLGTAFNIKSDDRQHTVEVTVNRGKVSIAKGEKTLGILMPNQQLSLNTLTSKIQQAQVDVRPIIAWQLGDFHFEDVSFGEAALQLEKHFNVKINFSSNELKACRFTGTNLNGERLENILKVICAFNNANYHIDVNQQVLIDGPGCNASNQ